MTENSRRIQPAGRPVSPYDIVKVLNWMAGGLKDAQLLAAIHAGGQVDHEIWWPELTEAECRTIEEQAAAVTGSRLRAWRDPANPRKPTWYEVRALIRGLFIEMS